jgi:hypothetical protein
MVNSLVLELGTTDVNSIRLSVFRQVRDQRMRSAKTQCAVGLCYNQNGHRTQNFFSFPTAG